MSDKGYLAEILGNGDEEFGTQQYLEAERTFATSTYKTEDGQLREAGATVIAPRFGLVDAHLHPDNLMKVGDEIEIVTNFDRAEGKVLGFVEGEDAAIVALNEDCTEAVVKVADHDALAGERVVMADQVEMGNGQLALVAKEGMVGGSDPTGATDQTVVLDGEGGDSGKVILNEEGEGVGRVHARHVEDEVVLVENRSSLHAIIAAAKSGQLAQTPTALSYGEDWEPIATDGEVADAKRAAERAKNDAHRRNQELAAANTAKSNADRGIL